MTARDMPMFPLGTVLFPHAPLPLHVFEPRYRAMTRDLIAGDGEFGVVLIERGHEVGGGEARFDIGTVARLVHCDELPDGRYAMTAYGVARLVVEAWLPDDPYPRARVRVLEDDARDDDADAVAAAASRGLLDGVVDQLRRVYALHAMLDPRVLPPTWLDTALARDVVSDHDVAAYELCARAPLGPIDALALLRCDSTMHRLRLLAQLLEEQRLILTSRLDDR
jgi:Lon protease-like protein